MMMGFGMIFSGLTIWLKNIGATTALLQNITMFFCGVYFPLAVLPEVARPVANYIPFYYSIEGLRRSLLPATPTSEMMFYTVVLLFLSVVFILIGLYTIHRGLLKAKKDGSLMFY
jgi:ABC-type polysaccharide/polyol phosphate export permease